MFLCTIKSNNETIYWVMNFYFKLKPTSSLQVYTLWCCQKEGVSPLQYTMSIMYGSTEGTLRGMCDWRRKKRTYIEGNHGSIPPSFIFTPNTFLDSRVLTHVSDLYVARTSRKTRNKGRQLCQSVSKGADWNSETDVRTCWGIFPDFPLYLNPFSMDVQCPRPSWLSTPPILSHFWKMWKGGSVWVFCPSHAVMKQISWTGGKTVHVVFGYLSRSLL